MYHREPPTGYPLPDDTEESPYQNDKASRQRASQQSSYLPWEYGAFFSLSSFHNLFFSFSIFSQYRTLFFIEDASQIAHYGYAAGFHHD